MVPASGYTHGVIDIPSAMHQLELHINNFPGLLRKYTDEELQARPDSGKWSKKEILGHLIDSAINNLKRFTEVQFLPQPYHIVPYQQNDLVIVNDYQNLPTEHLVQLWRSLNLQIVFIVQKISEEKLNLSVDPQYDNEETKTLGWIIADYVAHMEHHFRQIFPENSY
jgi:hypothetical protein